MPNHHRIYIELNTYSEYIWTQYIAGGVWYQLSHDVLPGTSAGHVKLQKSEWEDKDMHQDINDYSSIIHSLSHAYWVSHSWHICRWHVSPQIPTNDWTLFMGVRRFINNMVATFTGHSSLQFWFRIDSIFLNLPLTYKYTDLNVHFQSSPRFQSLGALDSLPLMKFRFRNEWWVSHNRIVMEYVRMSFAHHLRQGWEA